MARPSGRRTSQFQLPQAQPQPQIPSLENTFVGGLKTEFTGLNFPENSCFATSNCHFTRTGNVTRRKGINVEANGQSNLLDRTQKAVSTFVWQNAGGTGNSVIEVVQAGTVLQFYLASAATVISPLSTKKLVSTVSLTSFQVINTSVQGIECQYTSGNGYLFVFNPSCDPFYCSFDGTNIVANRITVQIRDFLGIVEPGVPANQRPVGASAEHIYNIRNQGWAGNNTVTVPGTVIATSIQNSNMFTLGSPITLTYTVSAGLGITAGNPCTLFSTTGGRVLIGSGSVNTYSGTSLAITIIASFGILAGESVEIDVNGSVVSASTLVNIWFAAVGAYPSNADIWWTFKDTSNNFNPAVTLNNVTLNAGQAPQGYYILNAFQQQRSLASGVAGLNDVTTTVRPRTGAWFQGRVWYSGVDASQPAVGDAQFYTWTENVYFSQVVTNVSDFGLCYENNDPTSETLSDELPTDGGVVQIQGCGSIYKLFPVVNGILVFAANGIWFITGNTGLGFTATDFTVSKVSGEHCISGTSFVDVQGWPIFWNQDGIYAVRPGQAFQSGQTALQVANLTLESIKTYYQSIPLSSKLFARGDYNHVTGEVQWLFKSTVETDITSRYQFDSVLVFLTYTQAFFPWKIPTNTANAFVHSINYLEITGATPATAPPPVFKYTSSVFTGGVYSFFFAEENDNVTFTDWVSVGGQGSYTATFTTGFRLKGQGIRKAQPQYVYVYSEDSTSGYTIQGIWDYAISDLANRNSTLQVVNNNSPLYGKSIRKHRIRGNGRVLQFVISSLPGLDMNISGWAVIDTLGIS